MPGSESEMVKRTRSPVLATGGKRECFTHVLDFQTTPPMQNAIEASTIVEYPCFTALPKDDGTPLEFRIGKADFFTDLNRTFINLTVQLLDEKGQRLPADAMVAPVNNIGYSMFQSVDLFLNDQKLTASDTNYVWSSYVYTLLYNSETTRKTVLRGSAWFPDTAGFFNKIPKEGEESENDGFKTRRSEQCSKAQTMFADGKSVTLFCRLFFTTKFDRLIPNQTEITIKLKPAASSLFLMANEDKYKMRVTDAKIFTTRFNTFNKTNRIISAHV